MNHWGYAWPGSNASLGRKNAAVVLGRSYRRGNSKASFVAHTWQSDWSRSCWRYNELCRASCEPGWLMRPLWTELGRDGSEDIICKVANVVASRVVFNWNNKSLVFTYCPSSSNLSWVPPDYLKRWRQKWRWNFVSLIAIIFIRLSLLNACTMLVTYRCKVSRFLTITGSTVIIKLFLPMEPLYSVTTILRWVIVRMGQV